MTDESTTPMPEEAASNGASANSKSEADAALEVVVPMDAAAEGGSEASASVETVMPMEASAAGGADVMAAPEAPPAPPPSAPAAPAPGAYATPPQQPYTPPAQSTDPVTQAFTSSEKSKVVAGILAILLGALGIHKFYLGYNTAGIIMLVVSVVGSIVFGLGPTVMAVIGIVEGVIYLTKTDQDFYTTYVANKKEWF